MTVLRHPRSIGSCSVWTLLVKRAVSTPPARPPHQSLRIVSSDLSRSLHSSAQRHLQFLVTPTSRTFSTSTTAPVSPSSPAVPTAPSTPPPAPSAAVSSPVMSPLLEMKQPLRHRLRLWLHEGRPRWRNFLVLGLAGAASYGVFSLSSDLIVFLDSVRHAQALEYAFVAGATVLASSLAFFSLARRSLPTPLAPAYRVALRHLRRDLQVRDLLGGHLRFGPSSTAGPASSTPLPPASPAPSAGSIVASGFRLVTRLPAGPRWSAEPGVVYWGWERYWKPRRLQFVTTVEGNRGHAVMLAQVDYKVDERRPLQWLSVERVVRTSATDPAQSTPSPPLRVVVEGHERNWAQ